MMDSLESNENMDVDDLVEFSSLPVMTAVYSLAIEHKSTQTSNEALDHEDQHGGNWPCRLCPAAFKTKDTLLNHRRLVHFVDEKYILFDVPTSTKAASSLRCLKCKKTFRNYYQKALHDKHVHKNLNGFKYKCLKCVQGFSTQTQWIKHQNTHKKKKRNNNNKIVQRPGDKWTCRLCSAGFKSKAKLLIHTGLVHSEDVPLVPNFLSCLECNETFPSHLKKAVHDKNVHKNLNGFKYKCFTCVKGFSVRTHWINHQSVHKKKNNKMKCPLCPEVFSSDQGLQIHKGWKHKDPINNKAGKCPKCDEVFSTIKALTFHENSHGDKWPCDLCPARFKMMGTVFLHRKKLHLDATTKYDFQPPARIFKCKNCNPIREFETQNKLKWHIEEDHKDTFKFQCSKCDEKYPTLYQKDKHEKSHFPISCPQCPNLMFKSDRALFNHKLKFHPIKVKCSKCQQIFSTEGQRDRHERIHGDDWPCLLCPAGFKTKQRALTHREKFHPEAEEYYYVAEPRGRC